MERKQKITFIMMVLIIVVFVLIPSLEQFTCSEPEAGITLMILQKSGLVSPSLVCPTTAGTLWSIMRNLLMAFVGSLIGYMSASGNGVSEPVAEEDEKYARWVRHLRSVMTEVEFPEDYLHESMIQKRSIF